MKYIAVVCNRSIVTLLQKKEIIFVRLLSGEKAFLLVV